MHFASGSGNRMLNAESGWLGSGPGLDINYLGLWAKWLYLLGKVSFSIN